jgi:hypothetical protein
LSWYVSSTLYGIFDVFHLTKRHNTNVDPGANSVDEAERQALYHEDRLGKRVMERTK